MISAKTSSATDDVTVVFLDANILAKPVTRTILMAECRVVSSRCGAWPPKPKLPTSPELLHAAIARNHPRLYAAHADLFDIAPEQTAHPEPAVIFRGPR